MNACEDGGPASAPSPRRPVPSLPAKPLESEEQETGARQVKDSGPPRPPSPPPDARGGKGSDLPQAPMPGALEASFPPLAVLGEAVLTYVRSQISPKGQQEQAELISQDGISMHFLASWPCGLEFHDLTPPSGGVGDAPGRGRAPRPAASESVTRGQGIARIRRARGTHYLVSRGRCHVFFASIIRPTLSSSDRSPD